MSERRVALVHDWLTGMRGGEKVLELLCECFPAAPIWTLLYNQGSVSDTISAHPIFPSLLQSMPGARSKYRNYLPLFPLFAELHKAHGADIVISSSHAVAKSMVKRQGKGAPFHICYIHTPMRYAWDLFDEYFGVERVGWIMSRLFFLPIIRMLRWYDRRTAPRVDLFVANSSYVAERVKRIYGRDAKVVPPPVDTLRFQAGRREKEDWYLVVSALVPYKRVDQTVAACSRLGRRLKVIGQGPELERIQKIAQGTNGTVEFLGAVDDEVLASHYRRARALLFPGVEDFGIVPVEAIASGCPVIALQRGGVLDSMTEQTAVFYENNTVEGLMEAMERFETMEDQFPESVLREQAQRFSKEAFVQRFNSLLAEARSNSLTWNEVPASQPSM